MRNKEAEISGHEIERALSEEVRECRERERAVGERAERREEKNSKREN